MGENIKVQEQHSTADTLREQIRDTESHITETVQSLEERISPRYLRQRGARQAKRFARQATAKFWEGAAKFLELAQHSTVQASIVGGSALWLLVRNRKGHNKLAGQRPSAQPTAPAGTAAMALGAATLQRLLGHGDDRRKNGDRRDRRKGDARAKGAAGRPAVSGLAMVASAAKAFFSGARASLEGGTARSGRKVAGRGAATTIGSALGNYWFSHKGHRV